MCLVGTNGLGLESQKVLRDRLTRWFLVFSVDDFTITKTTSEQLCRISAFTQEHKKSINKNKLYISQK